MILHPLQRDRSSGDEFLDAIGTGAQRLLQRGRGDVALAAFAVGPLPPVLRQYRELAHDLRKLAIARRIEGKLDLAIADFFGLHHVAVIGRILRMMFLERIERENHVVRRHRLAVMPFCLRPQTIGDGGKILGMADRLGQRAVFGRNFVQRRRHQRFVDELDGCRDRAFDAGNGDIEIVERPDQDLAGNAALGRIRIDVIEALEAGRIFDVAEQRQRVAPDRLAGRGLRMGRPQRSPMPPVRGRARPGLRFAEDVVG